MSLQDYEPSAAFHTLMDKISATIGSEDTKEAKYAKIEGILRLAMDPNKPTAPDSAFEVLTHLKGHMADAPMCGTDRLAAAFGLTVAEEGKRIVIKASQTETYRLREDEVHSARHMFETACVILSAEFDKGRVIYPTFNEHSRRAHINALKPYGEEVVDHFVLYLDKLKQKQETVVVQSIDMSELVDDDTGEIRLAKLESGKSYITGEPDRSKLKALLDYCENSQVSIRFQIAKAWLANDLMKTNPKLKLVSGGAPPIVVAYEASKRHPAHPLAPGPECKEELTKLIDKMREWVTTGVSVFTPVSLSAPAGASKPQSKTNLIFTSMKSEKKPNESVFPKIPKPVKDIYYQAILAGKWGSKAVLDKHNIVGSNPAIYHQDSMAKKSLPPSVMIQIQKVTNSLPTPNARLILKYVYFVLANKEIFEGDKSVASRLPLDPWMAAVHTICRHLEKYNLHDVVLLDNGDIYPKSWINTPKGMTVTEKEIVKTTATKKSPKKPEVKTGAVKKAPQGKPKQDVGNRKTGSPQKPLPGLQPFKPGKKAGSHGVGAPGKFMTDQQIAQLAHTAGQSAVQAFMMAQPAPTFTYQSGDWSEDAQSATGNY